jgi:CheY-like chemotaxis protein
MILIVDDHADTRSALVQILTLEGYEARGVGTGAEALLFLSRFKPRLVILDYSMPGMNGMEVLMAIRHDARHAAIPVIMFSAHATGEVRDQALKAGANAYVIKASLDWMELHRMVAEFAGPTTAPQPLPPTPKARDIG